MSTKDRPKTRSELVFRQLDDEWVVFDPDTEQLHVLNITSSLVWVHCTGEYTVGDIVREVRNAFKEPADPEVVLRDVDRALKQFSDAGLLE